MGQIEVPENGVLKYMATIPSIFEDFAFVDLSRTQSYWDFMNSGIASCDESRIPS